MGIKLAKLLGIFLTLSTISCSEVEVGLLVLKGNYYFSAGKFLEAQVSYMEALEIGAYREWVYYNLGNVYFTLKERKAALVKWEKAQKGQDPNLQFHIEYNKGLLALQEGNFAEAEERFIRALELDSTSIPAKVNLEYATLRLVSPQTEKARLRNVPPKGITDEGDRLLQYVRQKETNRWIASEKITVDETAEDW